MKPSEILREARTLIPDEEHWWRGQRDTKRLGEDGAHCAGTAINAIGCFNFGVLDGSVRMSEEAKEAHRFMQSVIGGGPVPSWNDDPHTSFEDLQLVFKRAIEAAEAVGR